MYTTTLQHFIKLGSQKVELLRDNPLAFFIGALLGGAYVGLGILLIFSLGAMVPVPFQKLVMGASFAIALILVVIAGAELFTGHVMYLTLGKLNGSVRMGPLLKTWAACWIGNFLGAALVASLFALGGANGLLADDHSLLYKIADKKMSASAVALFANAILCNWLVCLAIWMSSRVQGDVAKCVVIFWCLFAFIASGYEHSVANMTVFSLAIIGRAGEWATISGALYNLSVVTAGNIVGGAVMVALCYWGTQDKSAKTKLLTSKEKKLIIGRTIADRIFTI